MDYIKEVEGQKIVSLTHGADGMWFFLDGDACIKIKDGYYWWRLLHDGKVVMASSDLFVQYTGPEWVDFYPMEYEEPNEIDDDDCMEELFDALELHIHHKLEVANQLLENATIASFEVNALHDLTITFSNGALLHACAVMNIEEYNRAECNYIEKQNGRKKKVIFL